MSSVSIEQRHTRSHPCPICGGWENADRGQGVRCWGYVSPDGEWARCVRDEHSGSLNKEANSDAYRHRLHGRCRCGAQHGPELRAQHTPNPDVGIEATYDYRDENGALLFQVVRKAGKKFLQRKPAENGTWEWKLEGTRRVPYRLPELLAAVPDTRVYIVEGEKDVDCLRSRELVATCNPGGAGKWRFVAGLAATLLAGRDVAIIADADDVGRKHAEQIAESLHGKAAEVRVVELPEKDASNFFATGGTLEQLDAIVDSAPTWNPSARPNGSSNGATVHQIDPPPDADDWQAALAVNSEGKPRKEVGNCALIFERDPAWTSALRYDAFADRVLCGDFPSLPQVSAFRPSLTPPATGDITEQHEVYASMWLAHRWSVSWPGGAVRAGLIYAARQHAFHPLQDYLHACHAKWDRLPRLDSWAVDHLGVENTPVARAASSMFLISAVARALDPGCKVDHVLVLEGPQGKGKTTALEILFGKDWFLPDLPDLRDKDSMHLLAGCWCAIADELSAIRGAASVERAKSFFTRRVDVYRPPYGRDSVRRPRSCVFAATTNAPEYLTDETGNRRYWSLLCSGMLDFKALADARDQIWGEAMHRYLGGEHWWAEGEQLQAELREQQSLRVIGDDWDDRVAKFVRGLEHTTTADCLAAIGKEPKDWAPADRQRMARILTRLGWTMHQYRVDGSNARRYWPPA